MNSIASRSYVSPILSRSYCIFAFLVAMAASFLASCGRNADKGATFSGNTTVTLLATGTVNSKWTFFSAGVDKLTLTNETGKTVDVLTAPVGTNFFHVNGTMEPLATMSIPQGVYTAATASVNGGGFNCASLDSDHFALGTSAYAFGPGVATNITVALPAPISVTGASMGLLLDFQASKSLTFPGDCFSSGVPYSIHPAFALTSISIPGAATSSTNGKAMNHQGMATAIDTGGTGFSITAPWGPSWQVKSNGATTYQGITGLSQLAVGMPVDLDAAVQADGSMLATRIAVYDTSTANLSVNIGPLLSTNMVRSQLPGLLLAVAGGETSQGAIPWASHNPYWEYSNAVFQTSGQLTNVRNLPFSASFSASTMVAGQHVVITTHDSEHSITLHGSMSAATVTLTPQTINGTVRAISSDGGFTTYVVSLAPYDLFPTFVAQADQVSVLTDPNTVIVYADSDSQKLNSSPIVVGSMMRFYGLVFNDNGTLRMDCAQINDGVAE